MNLSPQEKIDALRDLTRGADDVFALRSDRGWRPCYTALSDMTLRLHLAGKLELGSYPLIPTDDLPACYWIAADFDGKKPGVDWKSEVKHIVQYLLDFDGLPCFVNLSRSAEGAHVRMLFKEAVPAWMARRWFTAWLEEAGVAVRDPEDWDGEVPPSFDRLIPPQDYLSNQLTRYGQRRPGNLAGSPLNGRIARETGGTLPLDPKQVAQGRFEPDGRHWEHVQRALDARSWGVDELRNAMHEAEVPLDVPAGRRRSLPVLAAGQRKLDYTLAFCEFIQFLKIPGNCSYPLWVALASQLHRFGDAGYAAFHELSQIDAGRYRPSDTDRKWEQTRDLYPVRCETLVPMGFRCPNLNTPACNGAYAPTNFADNIYAEIL